MKLSVCMITYNHEQFVEEAIRSVVAQETIFQYELVIGEDCSTDRTREIIVRLQQEFPDKIRLLPNKDNIGMLGNFVRTFTACKGEYIALLEGDDFWTSDQKLQRQVDFLELHPECAFCFHKTRVQSNGEQRKTEFLPPGELPTISTIELLLGTTNPIATCSVVFRNHLFTQFPNWYYDLRFGDWTLHLLNAAHGSIGYLPDIMATYRIHTGGIWSIQPSYRTIPKVIAMFAQINAHFNFEYNVPIAETIQSLAEYWAWELISAQSSDIQNQIMFELLAQGNQAVLAHLITAILSKASEAAKGTTWLVQQSENWRVQYEAQLALLLQMEQGRVWLEEQRANWQHTVTERDESIHRLKEWITVLEQNQADHMAILEQLQASNQQLQASNQQLQIYIEQLRTKKVFRALLMAGMLPINVDKP